MISSELLEILRCPETMQRLALAPAGLLQRLNGGSVNDRSGKPVSALGAGLLREDGAVLYPIVNGIPDLLVDDSIAVPAGMPR
ncbi:MAG TPA: hypothetical protein VGH90_03200 [Chthoniobacteraceae bacterium]|jgi:uncharacterized protein YbaR (Trm112 family)